MTLPLTTAPAPHYAELSEQRLLERICVSRPYYALLNPARGGNTFYASAVADLPLGAEIGPMGSAEISRHAAISGLCAAALAQKDDKRRFYLAQRAEYQGVPNSAPYGVPVAFAATLKHLGKRGARSEIVVTAAGKPLAVLTVDYTILTEYAFSRLFQSRYRPTEPQMVMNIDLPGRVYSSAERSVYEVDALPETVCAGHFADHPALPVALLMGQLGTAAWRLMGSAGWRGVQASVNATDLCWAGERARFEAEHAAQYSEPQTLETQKHEPQNPKVQTLEQHPNQQSTFKCQVSAGDRLVCTAEFRLEAH